MPRREHAWSLEQTLLKVPAQLVLQVWDNEKFKADDLLGETEPVSPGGDTAGDRGQPLGTGSPYWRQGAATGARALPGLSPQGSWSWS